MRAKLRREGKWQERSRDPSEPSTSSTPTSAEIVPRDRSPIATERGKSALINSSMSDGEPGPQKSIFVHSDTSAFTKPIKKRKSYSPITDFSESEDECEGSTSKKTCLVNHTVFSENGDTQKAAREVERCIRNREDCRGYYRGGVRRILGSEIDLASRIMFLAPGSPYSISVFDSETLIENLPMLEEDQYEQIQSYYQTYNSLGVVIRTLPNTTLFTIDILNYIYDIKDPYVLICEKSKQNVWHWHMIWFTDKRSDNAKRTLMQLFQADTPRNEIKSPKLSVSVQQTKSFKHLIKYILKEPIFVAVRNDSNLWELVCTELRLDKPKEIVQTETFPNVMVKEIIDVMRKNLKYTVEELMQVAPDIMRKYLHKSNIDAIVSNCKMYLLAPTDIDNVYERIVKKQCDFDCFFHIYAYVYYQGINPNKFLMKLFKVLFMDIDKINCFVIQGPSNTGKTTFLRELLSFYNWGEIQSSGPFMFQNCINKELLIWEEPLIGHDFVETCKKVFEGMATQVSVKYKPAQTLYRTPVLITTNKDLWHYCDSDAEALKNRCFIYHFSKAATDYSAWLSRTYFECRGRYKQFVAGFSYGITECLKGHQCSLEFDQSTASESDSEHSESSNPDGELLSANREHLYQRDQQFHRSTGKRLLEWWNNNRRNCSRPSSDFERSQPKRSSSCPSPSADNSIDEPSGSTGDTIPIGGYAYARRESSGGSRQVHPGDFTVDGHRPRHSRPSNRGVFYDPSNSSQYFTSFYNRQFGRGILKKIPSLKPATEEPELGWLINSSKSISWKQWLSLVKFFWMIYNACRRVPDS